MNTNKLRGKIVEKGLNVSRLADKINIDRATLYRKIKDESFTVKEARQIGRTLDLTAEEFLDIFFTDYVAWHANKTDGMVRR